MAIPARYWPRPSCRSCPKRRCSRALNDSWYFACDSARFESAALSTSAGGSAKQALSHRQAGVDIVVAQGTEGGGHTGEIGSVVLWPEVIDAVAPTPVLAAEIWDVLKDEDWVVANGGGKGWLRRLWDWQPTRSYGGSGGAGLGYGLPAALGVALVHKGSGKVCVNLQSDGDLLYVVSGFYTAAHHRLPLLTVTFNNRTYGNDEEHQEVVAKTRGRPVENKVVGIRIDDPAPDFARIAQAFGVHAEGPLDTAEAVGPALGRALRVVKDGRPALVDVLTRP